MPKSIRLAVLMGAVSMLTAAPASATTGPAMYMQDGPPGIGSNTAAVSGSAVSFGNHVLAIGGVTLSCVDVRYTITSITTTAATFDPAYSGCSLLVSGTPVATATISTPCDWSLSGGIFNTTTANVTGGSVTTNCVTTIAMETLGCTLHLPGQTKSGITSNNVNQAGSHDTSATPWGSKIVASITGLTYTTTGQCPGISEHGIASYAGTIAVRAVTASL